MAIRIMINNQILVSDTHKMNIALMLRYYYHFKQADDKATKLGLMIIFKYFSSLNLALWYNKTIITL